MKNPALERDDQPVLALIAAKNNIWPTKKGAPRRDMSHWTVKNLRDRASDLGEPFHEIYETQYSAMNFYAHPGTTGVRGINGEAFSMLVGRFYKTAADSYAEIVHVIVNEFKIEGTNPAIKEKLRDVRLYPFAETDEHREVISRSFRKA